MKSLPEPPESAEPFSTSMAARMSRWLHDSRRRSEYEKQRSTVLTEREDGDKEWGATAASLGLELSLTNRVVAVIERHMDLPLGKLYPTDSTLAVFVQPGHHYAFEEMIEQLASLLDLEVQAVAEKITKKCHEYQMLTFVADLIRSRKEPGGQ